MTEMQTIINALNSLSPLAVIGLLAYVVYLLVQQGRGQKRIATGQHQIATNHLHELPEMMRALARIEDGISETNKQLGRISEQLAYLRARVNGSGMAT